MDTSSVENPEVTTTSKVLIFPIDLSARLALNMSRIPAEKIEHPFIEQKDIKSETRLGNDIDFLRVNGRARNVPVLQDLFLGGHS